jgi:hypothetical protein
MCCRQTRRWLGACEGLSPQHAPLSYALLAYGAFGAFCRLTSPRPAVFGPRRRRQPRNRPMSVPVRGLGRYGLRPCLAFCHSPNSRPAAFGPKTRTRRTDYHASLPPLGLTSYGLPGREELARSLSPKPVASDPRRLRPRNDHHTLLRPPVPSSYGLRVLSCEPVRQRLVKERIALFSHREKRS